MRLAAVFVFISGVFAHADSWLEYAPCTFVESDYYDGDSFSLKANTGYTYIFRLYGADALETDKRYPSRIREQAKHFNIPESRVLHWGLEAKEFTKHFLKGSLTAMTRKEKSGSASKKNRYYAVIIADGERLDETLISAGLARAYGVSTGYPRKIRDKVYQKRLRDLEHKARKARKGIWSESL